MTTSTSQIRNFALFFFILKVTGIQSHDAKSKYSITFAFIYKDNARPLLRDPELFSYPSYSRLAFFSLGTTRCSTLSSFGWLENCMLWAEPTKGKKRESDGQRDRKTNGKHFFLSTDSWECVCAQIKLHCKACLFDFDDQHQINFSECTFFFSLSLAGYKKRCSCAVSTKQMGFCSLDFNCDCLWFCSYNRVFHNIDALNRPCCLLLSPCVYVCLCWDNHSVMTSGFMQSSVEGVVSPWQANARNNQCHSWT